MVYVEFTFVDQPGSKCWFILQIKKKNRYKCVARFTKSFRHDKECKICNKDINWKGKNGCLAPHFKTVTIIGALIEQLDMVM